LTSNVVDTRNADSACGIFRKTLSMPRYMPPSPWGIISTIISYEQSIIIPYIIPVIKTNKIIILILIFKYIIIVQRPKEMIA
jgi:hypothetical protein